MTQLLKVRDLQIAYGDVQVIWGIDFEISSGEVVALIGPNGAGKTTVLKAISGIQPSIAGRITFSDTDITRLASHRIVEMGVIHVPEGRQLWPRMTVEENILMGAYARAAREHVDRRLDEVLQIYPRLRERRSQKAGTLSGGEQQMCAIARALMSQPRLMMLDEPSLGLAPMLVRQVFETLAEISSSGVTILLIEQNVNMALELADRGYVLETGRIVLSGTGAELLREDHVQKAYLGVA